MTIHRYWALEAAADFAEHHDPKLEVAVYNTIVKHCPFEADTAYMPVPRCDGCKHWTYRPEYLDPHGACMADAIGSDCNDYTIIVPADFGCVQWEAK